MKAEPKRGNASTESLGERDGQNRVIGSRRGFDGAGLPAGAEWLATAGKVRWASDLFRDVSHAGADAKAGLALAKRYGPEVPLPGGGATALRWQILAAVGAADLTVARILEAHSDALAILAEAGEPVPDGRWGVFAAEAPNVTLTGQQGRSGWTVKGTKPWCSLGGSLDSALVTARTDAGGQLFAVDLRQETVRAEAAAGWVARGLRSVPSGPVHFHDAVAQPVGPPGWYLDRPGFAWGGIGVAACWFGGACAIAERLRAGHPPFPELRALAIGTVDVALHAAEACLGHAALLVDGGQAGGEAGPTLALRVRAVVADAAEHALLQSRHALGPAPLAFDERHARRVADLELYILQHHGERDLAVLGQRLAGLDLP
jgi:alkylation response protein AidB-like acyl-CoA dehydrogenase